jgi:hypothetical protein
MGCRQHGDIADSTERSISTRCINGIGCHTDNHKIHYSEMNAMPEAMHQLTKENKKFQYKVVQKGGTATIFGEAIEWLMYAGIVHKCSRIEHAFIPIKVYQNFSDFKLYMNDTGMLAMHSGIPVQLILSSIDTENTFLGALAENYVAQEFSTKKIPLFYWKSEDTAEIDFVLQQEMEVIPVEVKKGKRTRSRSMNMFVTKYNSPYAIRISAKNFGFENNVKSIPLYAVWCI